MSKKPEIEFETPSVEYETPQRDSDGQKGIRKFLKLMGGCWCGRKRADCDGSGTRITHLWGDFYNFTCPMTGGGNTKVRPEIRKAAIQAGLIKQEDKDHG